MSKFSDLGLSASVVLAVSEGGYENPTPIQSEAIPHIVQGKDVLGCAQTGTGKTAAFALPILEHMAEDRSSGQRGPGRPTALVICPTRELATQIHASFVKYGRHIGVRAGVIFGGVKQSPQVRRLKSGVDVLVATPGRLLDLMNQGYIDLSMVNTMVLDEADHMLDMGFIHDIRRIVAKVPDERQTLLFSATMPNEIRRLADSILTEPVEIKTAPVATPAEQVEHSVFHVERNQKPELLNNILVHEAHGRTIVFSRTKHGSDKIVKVLKKMGIEAAAIHGNKSQNARERALARFKSGKVPVLIATDIAARGIDVSEVTHVVNYDLPNTPETYVHRIGRTARAGASGVAYSLCDVDELGELHAIERLIGRTLVVRDPADGQVVRESQEFPSCRGRGGKPGSSPSQRRRGGSGRPRGSRPSGRSSSEATSRSKPARGSRGHKPAAASADGTRTAKKKTSAKRSGQPSTSTKPSRSKSPAGGRASSGSPSGPRKPSRRNGKPKSPASSGTAGGGVRPSRRKSSRAS